MTWAQFYFSNYVINSMSRIVNIDDLNALTKCDTQILSYERVEEARIICFVNKAKVLLTLTYVLLWYKSQYNVAVLCWGFFYEHIKLVNRVLISYFVKEMAMSLL